MSWWNWHSLPDDLATDLDFDLALHRTSKYNQRQTFIQVNDVKTKNLIALPADICWWLFFSQQLFEFFQEPLGIWSVQGAAPAPHEHILCYWRVHRWMPTVFVFQDHVSRKEFFQRPPRPVHTETTLLTQQVHMNVNTCPTPPHPNPPMCTKHHGLLKAVLQLVRYISPTVMFDELNQHSQLPTGGPTL